MIKQIEDNNLVECINLMRKSCKDNDYGVYDYNELTWISHLANHVANRNDPNFVVIGDYTEEGTLRGFLLASTFRNFYTQELVMDVKDCIVDHDFNNAFTVTRLFNHMIDHVKQHGGKHWRADSLRAGDKAIEYTEFLAKKYNARPFYGVHGSV